MKNPTHDLIDDWRALGLRPRRQAEGAPCPKTEPTKVLAWLGEVGANRHTAITITGGSPQERGGLYNEIDVGAWCLDRQYSRTWLDRDPLEDFTDRVRRLNPLPEFWQKGEPPSPSWRWLWALAGAEDMMVAPPLSQMVDRPYHLVHDAVRLLMCLRFAILEGDDVEGVLSLITRWATRKLDTLSVYERKIMEDAGVARQPSVLAEQMDILLVLMTMAEQNGVLGKTVFVFDDLEAAVHNEQRPRLRELHAIMQSVQRWAGYMEIPVGLILGFDARKAAALRRMNPKLTGDVLAGLELVR